MIEVGITVSQDGSTWRADTTHGRVINGNSDIVLALTFDGAGWGLAENVIRIVAHHPDGTQSEETITTTGSRPWLPAVNDTYLLCVYVTRNGRAVTIPAIIACDACITDDSGLADDPAPDIYDIMTEYISQRRCGSQSRADALLEQLYELRETAPPAVPGDAYRLASKRSGRVTTVTGMLTLADGTELEITADMIAADSLGILSDASVDDALLPGGVPSAELTVTLRTDITPEELYGAKLELIYSIQRHDEHWCDVPLGLFTVAAAEAQSDSGVAITGYDDMQQLERIRRDVLPFTADTAYTPQQIVQTIVTKSGVSWDGIMPETGYAVLPSYIISRANSSIETARDLLAWIMQVLCSIAFFSHEIYTENGRKRVRSALRLRRIAKTDPVTALTPHELISSRVSRLPYRLYKLNITATLTKTDGSGSGRVIRFGRTTLWADGVTADLSENPLWDAAAGYDSISAKTSAVGYITGELRDALDPVTYDPGEVEIYGDPAIYPLDWIKVRTLDGEGSYPVTRTDWHYRGQHTLASCGTEAVAGVAKSQADKAALAHREDSAAEWDITMRLLQLTIIQSTGHRGMAAQTHGWLSHFTHKELGGG